MLRSNRKSGLILALDVPDLDQATSLAVIVSDFVDVMKVGLPLLLSTDLRTVVRKLKEETSLPILVDIKIADVPDIASALARATFEAGADALTVHGFIGPSAIEECIREARGERDVIVMTEITHPDATLFMEHVSEDIARLARDIGATGIQAPGTRPERVRRLREIVGKQMLVVSCGLGAQGGRIGSSLNAGADFEIIGRSIYNSQDPRQRAREISETLRRSLGG